MIPGMLAAAAILQQQKKSSRAASFVPLCGKNPNTHKQLTKSGL